MFTLEQIRCFVAVAEYLHFGRAAQALAMTQPPLSRQIKNLEKSLGVSLFERNNRSVEMTEAGKVFLREAKTVLADVERAGSVARMAGVGVYGHLRIGYTSTAGSWLLGEVLSLMTEKLPEVSIEVEEMVTSRQVEALREHRIDIALGRYLGDEGISGRVVHSEGLVLAAPESHKLLDSRILRREDLNGEKVLMYSPEQARYFYDLVVKHFSTQEFKQGYSLSQVPTMLGLVSQGQGLALVPESAMRLHFEGVEYRHFDDLPRGVVEMFLLSGQSSVTPLVRQVVELLSGSNNNSF